MTLFAKKSLGQHFLTSKHVLGQIMAAANITPGENILEIGPGTGVLTRELVAAHANVVAVEKDSRAIGALRAEYGEHTAENKLTLIEGDILEMDTALSPYSKLQTSFFSTFSIVANIPYYITGAILEKFLEHGPRPKKMVLLVQKEVAERIVARDGKESVLSMSIKAFGEPKLVATVPPGAFNPPPTVDSAILSIENINNSKFEGIEGSTERFFKIIKAGFAHKRKVLIRNLEQVAPAEELKKTWNELGLSEKVRAEDLRLENWLAIAQRTPLSTEKSGE